MIRGFKRTVVWRQFGPDLDDILGNDFRSEEIGVSRATGYLLKEQARAFQEEQADRMVWVSMSATTLGHGRQGWRRCIPIEYHTLVRP
jgi:hypothetical protein